MKSLCGVVLLCLSLIWVIFWCARLFDPLRTDPNTLYQIVFLLLACLAFIPVLCAAALLNRAWRSPLVSAPITQPVRKLRIWTLAAYEMRAVPMVGAILLASINSAGAQSDRGPAFPTEAQRGPAFPKYVSPSANSPTNWVAPAAIPEPAPQSRSRWWGGGRWHHFR